MLAIPLIFYSGTSTQVSWEIFTQKDGLAADEAMQIFEDSEGNIWFLTVNNGIMKYDGDGWTNYSTGNGLVSNEITAIHEDKSGTIWLGALKGLMRYNGNSFDVISESMAWKILEDSSGNIWFGGSTLQSFDGKNVIKYTKNSEQLPNILISLFYYDKGRNTMWIGGSKSGMSSFDGVKWKIHNEDPGAPTNHISCVLTDDNGTLWAGTPKGVYCYNGTSWTRYSVEQGLIPDDILILHKDRSNRIWAISGKDPSESVFQGAILAGISALSKSGLSVFCDGKWSPFTEEPNMPDSRVIKIFETSKGELWFDTYVAGIYRYDGKSWYEFKKADGFRFNHFVSIFEDSKGNIWFGSLSGGIGKFDGRDWAFYNKETGLPSDAIISILEDSKGKMWFGTDKGILRYSP